MGRCMGSGGKSRKGKQERMDVGGKSTEGKLYRNRERNLREKRLKIITSAARKKLG